MCVCVLHKNAYLQLFYSLPHLSQLILRQINLNTLLARPAGIYGCRHSFVHRYHPLLELGQLGRFDVEHLKEGGEGG